MRTQLHPQGAQPAPYFGPCLLWLNGWMDQDATWYEVSFGPGRIVLHGNQLPLPKGAQPPIFDPYLLWSKCCGRMAGWIKMPLGRKVGPSDIVLDGDPAPLPKKAAEPPIFGPCLLWPNGRVDQDGTWHGGGPRGRPQCARWGPSSPSPKKGPQPPPFLAHFYCDQTAACIKMPLSMDVGIGPGHILL